ncbi:Protein csx2 like protein [Verticillium longisporum]|nr:Protein csx2 like protein [Verticillium longisporum]
MGIVSSRPDDGASLYLRDQNRLSISSIVVTNPRTRNTVNIAPNAFPASRIVASRPAGESTPIEFVQDLESAVPGGAPNFILKLSSDEELIFTFTIVIRQSEAGVAQPTNGVAEVHPPVDTQITGLTYVYASSPREVENLVTREFHADPNLHKNANVELVGDFATGGSPSVAFDWTWKWKPPKSIEDRGGGWRNSCSFVEYDSRAHCLHTLASFSYWVSNTTTPLSHPNSPSPPFHLAPPPKHRVASSQSVESRISHADLEEPASPLYSVDVVCPKPGDDMTVTDDGPVFRATIKALEQKTGNMRMQVKRVLKKAESAYEAQTDANDKFASFLEALKEASATNANAVQPAIDHYFDKIAQEIMAYERRNTLNLQKIVIEPLSKVYTFDIKRAEDKKRDFEEESKDYYAYLARYLGQRHDSVKAKKLAESDTKYQTKRRTFELKRFDYSSFMQDLHARKIDTLLPQLEALSNEVSEADKEFQYQRREREEKRRLLEKSNADTDLPPAAANNTYSTSSNGQATSTSDSELGRADSTGSQLKSAISGGSQGAVASPELSRSPGSLGQSSIGSPAATSKFKGIRDLEERDHVQIANAERHNAQRKEGLLWALSRPTSHVDPRNLNKPGWHKFWIVLDQGKLSEYSNWKQRLDLHMDPIDLRMASVREARNAERRFCFEVITPHNKRVYQATSEEDMNSWILSINNALQSAVEGRMGDRSGPAPSSSDSSSFKRDIGGMPARRITVGAKPSIPRAPSGSYDDTPDKLLQMLRDNDQGNCWCSDCGSGAKVEWVSINLAIILCIECSGIHRSLGTHISKVRSLTLDITSFTADIVELLMLVGNRVANMIWEAKLDASIKPGPQATREQRLRFITAKYVDRAYVEPISTTLSRYSTPDETLLAGIKKNEVQQVIYAMALKANPNATDKSRGTHAVFLALAAADPASPSAVGGQQPEPEKPVPFPVAEMLVQNGAEIPTTMPAFPLSRSAQLYVEQKRGRSVGISRDGIGSLRPSQNAGEKIQQDMESRLHKRMSAGGRLAKSPIPER